MYCNLITFETLSEPLSNMDFVVTLRPPDSKGLCRVELFCRVNGEQCFVPTKIKILNKAWDKNKKKITAAQPGHEKITSLLNKRKGQLQSVFDDLEYHGIEPSVGEVKKRFKEKIKGKPAKNKDAAPDATVPDLLVKYTKDFESSLKPSYLRKFITFARHLEIYKAEYDSEDEPVTIKASEFGLNELNRYINDYLIDEVELENVSIWDHVRKIRLVMKRELGRSNVHPDCVKFKWKASSTKPVFLTNDEIDKIESCDILEEYEKFRDEFIFRAYTGLRWSDCHQLREHHFIKHRNGDVEIDFSAIKTNVNQNLILATKAKGIVTKWKYSVPKLSLSECNKAIKEICRAAGIDYSVERVSFSGSRRIVQIMPKWKRVSTHVARRSFGRKWVDLAAQKGSDPLSTLMKLQKYYGHSKLQQTIDYIGWEAEEVNKETKRLFG